MKYYWRSFTAVLLQCCRGTLLSSCLAYETPPTNKDWRVGEITIHASCCKVTRVVVEECATQLILSWHTAMFPVLQWKLICHIAHTSWW